jgi:hypothetical protein
MERVKIFGTITPIKLVLRMDAKMEILLVILTIKPREISTSCKKWVSRY